jgi:hypothetical protein
MRPNEEDLTEFEQTIDTIDRLARFVRTYYATLIDEGFSREEALVFTLAWQNAMLANSKKP